METLAGYVAALGPPLCAVGLGVFLRSTRLFSPADGETAARFALWVTLPSLILQSFKGVSPADLRLQLPALAGGLLLTALTAAFSWLAYRPRHPKERGLLAGAAAGGTQLALAACPLAAALFGPAGLRAALLAGVANSLACWVAGYLLFSTAGAAFPERYEHQDGGTYRGEWLGMLKQGYGVYAYPSGARYEGEWRNNQKEGRGVYRFPKGGAYEGEWRNGRMEGLGVRTYASGRVQAGVWREGKLVAEMEEWQCTLAVEGASEAAAAARRVQVGGGGAADALQQLAADPTTWAYMATAALALAGRSMTPTLELVTAQLATAHAPLALVALGLTAELAPPPQPRQAADVNGVLALRLLPPLLLAAMTCMALGRLGWPAAQVLGLVGPVLLCALAPAASQVLDNAHRFRLNENLAAAITRTSTAAALALMPLLGLAAALSAAAGSVLPFVVALLGAAAAVAAVTVAARLQATQQRSSKVRMVYAPVAAAASAGSAAAGQSRNGGASSAGTAAAATQQPQATAAAPAASGEIQDGQADGRQGTAPSPASEASSAAAAAACEPPQEQQQPRRRSAFSDVSPDRPQQQPPQALCQQRLGCGMLRLRQALRPRPARLAPLPVPRPAAALLRAIS